MKIAHILQPAVALMAWTMVMWLWMYVTRIPAMNAAKLDPDSLAKDPTRTLDDLLPASVQWKAHNYNHLHEAPTLFYAVCLVIAVAGAGNGTSATVAWAYVALRVVHSLVQATVNKVMVRFILFSLSSVALMALIYHAAKIVFAA
ncbi:MULTISPECIES: MAPEG family protein [Novosphingobium]|uniref:MAPEG family protein n=1 Tax=Novosphingobium subterraneum TaxID=48936 RepID=A0A0B9AG32_9SPHN|nr:MULTISPECIES: MAPEG family protein [Novosphingobium]KHS48298.1 MAPEG family protein [Novosphingobium subterraneum]QOV92788.1 MAPEG family protein [Novosphingobium sp. ES2-1]